jgi:CDP-6-deoxy-D-xylo-4-hexulose-3-dehydrase
MKKYFYPLVEDPFNSDDIKKGIDVLKSKQLNISTQTHKLENFFSTKFKSKYSLMVNSGSSANLLALQCLINPYRANRLKKGDEIIIPTLCWSTSLWPIIQSNLTPVFVDINKETLNIDTKKIEKKITKRTKAILLVHVLGNSCNMDHIMQLKKKYNLILIEDTCESIGSKYRGRYLGTFGEFSSFSFYTSHQISAGEGGMICCKNKTDYNILKSLRSHGWSRGTTYEKKYTKLKFLDSRFIFFNSGFNLRPLEVSAAIALNQLKRSEKLENLRNMNRSKIISMVKKNKTINNKIYFFEKNKNVEPSWFGLPIKISNTYKKNKKIIVDSLEKSGIETRPIISGNFTKQPASIKYKINIKEKFKETDDMYKKSFFIGLPTKKINKPLINKIEKAFEKAFQ